MNKVWDSYYVTNDHVLSLIKTLRDAPESNKDKILDSLVKLLGYLVQSKIKGYKLQIFYGDLLQEGKVGLLKAIRDFDPIRGINFFKFACWHIQHQVKLYLHWYRKANRGLEEENYFGTYEDAQDGFEQFELQQIISGALENLPEIDKRVLTMRFGIYDSEYRTFKQIGDELSLSKQRVEQIQKRALHRLKNNKEIKQLPRQER